MFVKHFVPNHLPVQKIGTLFLNKGHNSSNIFHDSFKR